MRIPARVDELDLRRVEVARPDERDVLAAAPRRRRSPSAAASPTRCPTATSPACSGRRARRSRRRRGTPRRPREPRSRRRASSSSRPSTSGRSGSSAASSSVCSASVSASITRGLGIRQRGPGRLGHRLAAGAPRARHADEAGAELAPAGVALVLRPERHGGERAAVGAAGAEPAHSILQVAVEAPLDVHAGPLVEADRAGEALGVDVRGSRASSRAASSRRTSAAGARGRGRACATGGGRRACRRSRAPALPTSGRGRARCPRSRRPRAR